MLCFKRRENERIVIVVPGHGPVTIRVHTLTPFNVKIAIDAPTSCAVHRGEIYDAARARQLPTDVQLVALNAEDAERVRAAASQLRTARTA